MVKALSADPGMTTGNAVVEHDIYSFWQIDCRSIEDYWQFLHDVNPDVLLYEDFKHRPNLMKAELYSKEVIGVIRLYAALNKVPIVFTCLPAEAKAFWDDAKIKKVGLWHPGENYKHSMDALRVYLTHRQKTDVPWLTQMLQKLK